MNFSRLPKRSSASIVQQMNTISTKDMYRDFFAGKPLNIPAGSDQRSFDCEDQTKVDWDSDSLKDCDNLIEQHFMREKFVEHFNPKSPVAGSDPVPVPEPVPDPTPAPTGPTE